jgi:CDP-diacylglycerol--glycerol-3-phosphate 3-phosphatidyltransferase
MSEGVVIAAGLEGKHKTAFQVAAITFLIIHYTYPVDAIFFSFDLDANRVGTLLLYFSLVLSVWSGWLYFRNFVRAVYGARSEARAADASREGVRTVARTQARGP